MATTRQPTAAKRLADMERALGELADIVANLPSEGEARRLLRIQRQIRIIGTLLIVPVLASLVFLVTAARGWNDTKAVAEANRAGVSCVLGQLFEHRVTNQEVHDRMAGALHVDPTPPTPLPPRYDADTLTRLCRPFFPGGHE